MPEGFLYRTEFLTPEEERELLSAIEQVAFSEVRMHGVVARRRTAHYGWLYGYESWRITPGPPMPDFLLPVRERCAAFADVKTGELTEALVTEYPAGAGIGWHRDAPMFGVVVALSLLGRCRLRFQRGKGDARETAEQVVEPRSIYALTGPARNQWQHSIPPIKEPRYSITFRTVRRA